MDRRPERGTGDECGKIRHLRRCPRAATMQGETHTGEASPSRHECALACREGGNRRRACQHHGVPLASPLRPTLERKGYGRIHLLLHHLIIREVKKRSKQVKPEKEKWSKHFRRSFFFLSVLEPFLFSQPVPPTCRFGPSPAPLASHTLGVPRSLLASLSHTCFGRSNALVGSTGHAFGLAAACRLPRGFSGPCVSSPSRAGGSFRNA